MRPSTLLVKGTRAKQLLLLLLLLAAPALVQAQFNYTINGDGSLNLARYTGSAGAVVIPNTTNGLPVTTIGDAAFFECASVTNVAIGTNVASIGGQAFSYSSLATILIPAGVTNIGFDAFADCIDLMAFTVDTNNPVFGSVAGVLFNQNLTTLITYPGGKAGSYAVPASITSIGDDAFFECAKLTSVTLSANVTNIGNSAFYVCTGLTAITVDTNNPGYSSVAGVLFNRSQTTLIQYPAGNTATSYAIPDSVTNVANQAFFESASLVKVMIGTNVTIIGAAAFEDSPALASITFPDNVTLIEGDAFAECTGLTNVVIGAGVTNIQSQAFLGCTSLIGVAVATNNPAFISVANVLFNLSQTTLVLYPAGSSGTAYAIPNSVTHLGDDAFHGSYNLASVTLGTNVASIGDGAFSQCYSLTGVTLPNSVTNLGFSIFYACYSLTNVMIGTGVTSIGFQVFAYCSSLTGIYFQGNAPGGGPDVFDGDNLAIVYYLPGAKGWGTLFDGLSTAPWLPHIQTGDASFGVQADGFGFTIDWAPGRTVVVQASTNLVNPVWSPVGTNIFAGVSSAFRDSQWTNYPLRFYRLDSP